MPAPLRFLVPGGDVLRRGAEDGRRRLRESRLFRRREVECPAGCYVGATPHGSGCYCRLESTLITEGENPSSLASFCFGDYTRCPTWRAERDREGEQRLADISVARPRRELATVPGAPDGVMAVAGDRAGRDEGAVDVHGD